MVSGEEATRKGAWGIISGQPPVSPARKAECRRGYSPRPPPMMFANFHTPVDFEVFDAMV